MPSGLAHSISTRLSCRSCSPDILYWEKSDFRQNLGNHELPILCSSDRKTPGEQTCSAPSTYSIRLCSFPTHFCPGQVSKSRLKSSLNLEKVRLCDLRGHKSSLLCSSDRKTQGRNISWSRSTLSESTVAARISIHGRRRNRVEKAGDLFFRSKKKNS